MKHIAKRDVHQAEKVSTTHKPKTPTSVQWGMTAQEALRVNYLSGHRSYQLSHD